MKHPNKEIMQKAIDIAKKKRVVVSIIVKGDKIISIGVCNVNQTNQPFRHGEINAIEKACKKFKSHKLTNCWLYTTYEPCPMCASACVWARLKGVVYGANMKDRNKNYTQRILIPCKSDVIHILFQSLQEKICLLCNRKMLLLLYVQLLYLLVHELLKGWLHQDLVT